MHHLAVLGSYYIKPTILFEISETVGPSGISVKNSSKESSPSIAAFMFSLVTLER
jgi:hypothetical protein